MVLIVNVALFYSLCFNPYIRQLLVQFAALLSCHNCNSVAAICLLDVGK